MKIVKDIFNAVFSFGGFVVTIGILILLGLTLLIRAENAENALIKATTKACYDNALIKVDTDAGFYCVAPANLIKIEVKL